MLGYHLLESNPTANNITPGQDSPQLKQGKPLKSHQHTYHQYHFIQQQQHFQYLQNALASSINQPTESQQQQHQLQQQQQKELQLPYHPSAVFKPNYMQDVLLNETCILNSPMNSMDGSTCSTTKTTPLMHSLSVHELDQIPLNNHDHYYHHHNPHHHHHNSPSGTSVIGTGATGSSDGFTTFEEDRKCILPSPLSPITSFSGSDGKQNHEEYLNFITTFSIHPQATSSLVFRHHHHRASPAVRHSSYDLNCSTSSSSSSSSSSQSSTSSSLASACSSKDNIMATPDTSPSAINGNFEDHSSKFPVIPSSPTFPVALNLSHGTVFPQKMPKQEGPTLQPAFEIRKITSIKNKSGSSSSLPTTSPATVGATTGVGAGSGAGVGVGVGGRSKNSTDRSFATAIPTMQPFVSMKKRLLARYSSRLLQRMRLAESDNKCRKHCQLEFTNYLELIEHYEENGLHQYLQSRNFNCPVKECPMNIIGFDKRADLRHHVHSDHLTHGLVSPQYSRYSDEIQKFLFVCDEPRCGKGFYRSDTLNRHVKLVHKRINNPTRKRRRVNTNNKNEKKPAS